MAVVSLPAGNIDSRLRGAAWSRSYQRTACSLGGAAQRGNAPLQPAPYIGPGENFSSLENGSVFPWETGGSIAPPLHPSEIIPSTRMSSETNSARLVRRLSCSWTPPKGCLAQLLGSDPSCVCILDSITLLNVGRIQSFNCGLRATFLLWCLRI